MRRVVLGMFVFCAIAGCAGEPRAADTLPADTTTAVPATDSARPTTVTPVPLQADSVMARDTAQPI
jgi:type IV pilus biogenesis protein CpaD/CtpE